MGLSKVVFTKNPEKEIEVDGHKIVVKKLTARDITSLDLELEAMGKEDVSIKAMLAGTIDLLSSIIVSVDGEKSDSKADAKEFLMNLEQRHINEIFTKAEVYGENLEKELKN